MIRAEGLTKYYESRCVVSDLTFSIEDNEIVGFLGLNGAGKTTVLRMLSGLLSPSAGRIEIDGCDLLADPLGLRWRIGFLPEPPPLYDDMRVRSYLTFAARLRGKDKERVEAVLEMTDLTGVAEQDIGTLSHGFRQRLGIAQAIVHDPDLVVLDEPINGLDPMQIKEMRELILRLREKHTVLVSSHILTEISQTCDRVLVLNSGTLAFSGTEAELRTRMNPTSRQVDIVVLGARAHLEAVLESTNVAASWSFAREEADAHVLRVVLGDSKPEELAAVLVRAGLGLRRLEPVATELESLFLAVTGAKA